MHVGASTVLLEKATPAELLRAIAGIRRDRAVHGADLVPRDGRAGARASASRWPPAARCASASSAGEALSAADARAVARRDRHRDDRRHRRHRDAAHLHLAPTRRDARPGATGVRDARLPRLRDGRGRQAGARRARSDASRSRARPAAATSTTRARPTTCATAGTTPATPTCMDADGYFHYQSRTDDMIVSAGYNIAAPEVEEALLRHAAVADCAVVGAAPTPSAARSSRPSSCCGRRMRPAKRWCASCRISSRRRSRRTSTRARSSSASALPRTETGKLQRFRLRSAS